MFKTENYPMIFNNVVDDARTFPQKALDLLRVLGLLKMTLNLKDKNTDVDLLKDQNILEILYELGKGDLSVSRIFEGHINALLLIKAYGSDFQKKMYFKEVVNGKIFGIWNTERPSEGLEIIDKKDGAHLKGAKTFCSGAKQIDRAVVTAKSSHGIQMLVLNIEEATNLQPDWSFWNPSGMKASTSCRFDFTGIGISPNQYLGRSGDYYLEPMFSWGAVRFASIQLGAAQKVSNIMKQHLIKTKRTDDPYQKMRAAEIAISMQTAQLWLKKASIMNEDNKSHYTSEEKINFANMMRTITVQICEQTINLAEKSIGLQGTLMSHKIERLVRDLKVYLKQAGPDSTLAEIGKFTLSK